MSKILVTGGAGFIGSHVCEALVKRGDRVICLDNFADYYGPDVGYTSDKKARNIEDLIGQEDFDLISADIRNASDLENIFATNQGIDAVIHLAAMAGVRRSFEIPDEYAATNINGTRLLLINANQFGVRNFVFASSSSVYGDSSPVPFSEQQDCLQPISPYAETKLEGESLCRENHEQTRLPTTCLRFFTVYGPRGRPDMIPYKFTRLLFEGKPLPVFGDGTTQRDYTFIEDIVKGIIAATDRALPFEILNLGNSRTVRLIDFIKTLERLTGRTAQLDWKPPQKGDVQRTYADITKAKQLLDYNPQTTIEEGLRQLVDWYEKNR